FEDGVLRQVFTAFKEGDLQGNPGMQQSSLALAAVIIDHYPETQEWLNFDFKTGDADWEDNVKTGGNIMEILVDDVDHDGQGNESAPGYNALWVSNWLEVAKALDGYVLPDGVSLDDGVDSDLFQNARFQKMFKAMYHLLLTNNYTANIGDTGQTGKATRAVINLDELILGYDKYGDDELAQAIYLVNGDSSKGITLDVFSENPNAVSDDIQDVLDEKGELDLGSEDQTGFGLAVLRDGETSSTYNFLNMAVSDKSDGLVINRDYPPVAQIEPDVSQGVGQSIAFDFTYSGDTSQQYQFYMEIHVVSSIWATYSVELNGHPLGKIDFADGTSGTTILKLADTYLNPGTNTVKFTNTQAGPSGSLKMGVRTMYFLEQGAVLPSNTAIANTTQRALWMYYGGPGSHAHADPLNLGYIAYDLDLMPDLGYPDTTNDSLTFFTKTTKSHNTVIVNGQPVDATGTPTHFDDTGDVKLMSIRDNGVSGIYSAANGLYERTAALIKVDDEDSYIVDLFHLNGGSYYDYSFHTGESETANTVYTGLTLAPVSGEEASLKNFRKDTDGTSGAFSIDWNLLDTYNRYGNGIGAQTDVHLKITMLGDYDEVTVADGIPPQNVDSNPDKLEYLYVRSNDSNTTYASVIEPYQGESNITSIEEVPVTENGIAADGNAVKAIKVTLSSGRVDYVVNALDTAKTYRVANLFDFKGFYGVYTLLNGSLAHTYINDGTTIGNTDALNKATGTVTDHTATLSAENYIDIQTDQNIDAEELTGRYIYIENDGETNAVYKILDATPQGSSLRLNIGDTSVVRGWKNILDFGEGYEFDFDLGAAFTIPLSDF
ncbi:MAG: heparinase II/III family protein, partial [Acetanaerobacterium sp.]